jgi:transcriptional regulator with GAF, ATPase, and Fis domain
MTDSTFSRERTVGATFANLADTLVSDYDVVDLLDVLANTCVDLGLCDAAGLVLADVHGLMRVLASSSEQSRLLELLEIQNAEGPCLDCFRIGAPVSATSVADAETRWPNFIPAARAAGFESVHALPMRLRDQTIGALNLFLIESQHLDADAQATAQALADVATIGILQQRVAADKALVTQNLQSTLTNRLVVEQAKGVLAEVGSMPMDATFRRLRDFARGHTIPVSEVASLIIRGELDPRAVIDFRTEGGTTSSNMRTGVPK